MKKRRGDKTNLYSIEYLILYIFGSIILIVSYLYDMSSFFLVGLLIMVISLYLSYMSSNLKGKGIKVAKPKKKKPRVKKKRKKKHLKFKLPKLKIPKVKLPKIKSKKFKLPKLKIPQIKLRKKPIKPKLRTDQGRKLRFVIKHSGKITETDFDVLVKVVNQVGIIKVSSVAKIFGISVKQAEGWGKILEKHNLLQLHYPPIGEPELRKWKD